MTGWHKSIRALFAAVMTTMLAVLMHVGAGGDFSALGTGFVFVLVLWAAMILAGRRLGYLALAAILGLGQLLMHASMGWFGPMSSMMRGTAGGTASASPDPTMSAAEHELMTPATGSLDLGQAAPMGHSMGHANGAGPGMIIAHIVAVIVTAIILKRGEDLLFSILQLALGPVVIALRALASAQHSLAGARLRVVRHVRELPRMVPAAVIGPNYRRGPPALV
ncbi:MULTISPECIES: hypothetical protein [unclassified Brevibacterium]|uniref:hypothetical protein n=1 Tax=unclassified Brevibacterium TaxID=2614124 RepID=UPI001BA517E5|nr:hypothetical protein [Brevibacterium sp. W7.2]